MGMLCTSAACAVGKRQEADRDVQAIGEGLDLAGAAVGLKVGEDLDRVAGLRARAGRDRGTRACRSPRAARGRRRRGSAACESPARMRRAGSRNPAARAAPAAPRPGFEAGTTRRPQPGRVSEHRRARPCPTAPRSIPAQDRDDSRYSHRISPEPRPTTITQGHSTAFAGESTLSRPVDPRKQRQAVTVGVAQPYLAVALAGIVERLGHRDAFFDQLAALRIDVGHLEHQTNLVPRSRISKSLDALQAQSPLARREQGELVLVIEQNRQRARACPGTSGPSATIRRRERRS